MAINGAWRFLFMSLEEQARHLVTFFPLSTNSQSAQLLLHTLDVSMITLSPLKQLHDFDRASPQFHKQLSDFLCGNEYQSDVPNLQGEDLVWLVEYLDSVSLQTTFPTLHPTPA